MDDDLPPLKRKFGGLSSSFNDNNNNDNDNDDDSSSSRRRDGMGAKKAPRLGNGGGDGAGGKLSFAQKMMAKMGYVKGQGLGKEGEGMVNPIEVKLRPQGAGVGSIKERTAQYKEEQRRKAEQRGEQFEDSSEEEKRKRRERRRKKMNLRGGEDGGSGVSTPAGVATRKVKPKFRTVEDVRAAAPGLEVPAQMLSSILDATGNERKMLTSAAGLMTPTGLQADSEAEKIMKREKLELEAFIDAWHGVQEQKIYIEQHEGQHQVELDQQMEELEKLQEITQAVEDLRLDRPGASEIGPLESSETSAWIQLVDKLEIFQDKHRHDMDRYGLADAAVGAIGPVFKEDLATWDPLESPGDIAQQLQRIKPILGLNTQDELATTSAHAELDEAYGRSRRKKTTTAYETLIYTVWLPKIRTSVTNWNVLDHEPMIDVVKTWRPVLPPFIYTNLIDQLIIPKLLTALQSWDPRKRAHTHRHTTLKHAQAHTWIFPWLPYLPPYHLDPKASSGLVVDVKRKLRSVLDKWDITTGLLPGLESWHSILHSELDHVLIRHMLPRLALHLSSYFSVDPSDQDLTPLEQVLAWQGFFKVDVFARLLVAEFFPQWLATLHLWLTTEDANFEEIGQWMAWWRQQFPEKLSTHPDLESEWAQGRDMVNAALDLLDEGAPLTALPPPAAGPSKPIAKQIAKQIDTSTSHTPSRNPLQEPTGFKEIVEDWCTNEDLTMVPLREAHPISGLPLFRITASATGKGGVIVYLQGDVVWAQRKSDRSSYDPIGLDDKLTARAEGK